MLHNNGVCAFHNRASWRKVLFLCIYSYIARIQISPMRLAISHIERICRFSHINTIKRQPFWRKYKSIHTHGHIHTGGWHRLQIP